MTKTPNQNIQTTELPLASDEKHAFDELPKFAQVLIVVCVGAFFVLWVLYASQFGWGFSESRDHWGQFGDFVGGILNPIVSIGALFGIWYAVALQKRELQATKNALEQQATESDTANQREEKKKEEQLFMSILDKVGSSALLVTDGAVRTHGARYIDELGATIWNHRTPTGAHFAVASEQKILSEKADSAQLNIDEIVASFQPQVASYVHMVTLALRVLSTRISEHKLFSEIFCAQIGQRQLSLLCLLSCANQYSELKSLIQDLNLHSYLPQNEHDHHIKYGWFNNDEPKE